MRMGGKCLGRKDTSAFLLPTVGFSLWVLLILTTLASRYFGRARELPGVKELFASKKKDEDEENLAANYYKKFLNHGPAYYGDLDEADGKLLEYEMEAEERGTPDITVLAIGEC